jgi:hypothetical protein
MNKLSTAAEWSTTKQQLNEKAIVKELRYF